MNIAQENKLSCSKLIEKLIGVNTGINTIPQNNFEIQNRSKGDVVARTRFELVFAAPEAAVLGRCTTGLLFDGLLFLPKRFSRTKKGLPRVRNT